MSAAGQEIAAALAQAEDHLSRAEAEEAKACLDQVVALCASVEASGEILPDELRASLRATLARCTAASDELRTRIGAELQQTGTSRRAFGAYGR